MRISNSDLWAGSAARISTAAAATVAIRLRRVMWGINSSFEISLPGAARSLIIYWVREARAGNSIGPPADPVAWRIVVADPDLASWPSRHGASHFFRVTPDDLRVVP